MKAIASSILQRLTAQGTAFDIGSPVAHAAEIEAIVPYVNAGITVQMEATGIEAMFGVFSEGDSYVSTSPERSPVTYSDNRAAIRATIEDWRRYKLGA